ncbi:MULTISPECIES: hypothetical protein [Mycobacterium]|uniref:Uncharacterized protein n=1 Tax=Mycobacterium kiyosense TaxID=2871094 RepID=A0A9P3V049_9MYCO|nr:MULTISPECIES: hypothetical protein [Mycobacterium]BDB45238.1 hypothetical protein IWGMT90018_56840 [Mycobacterium kiyosense]BDE16711.1 hypothetical protein MKCMC460_55710 [Mycobacterium sp. 20KCMC460]GLB83956.1 hypothetical protein SRL2020028_32120 [Mycobacterium kiyosense]GLB90468.1 hypothetical protein SRL2020130_32850 [Mycobacterium kiyosense]GLB96316.1 hypothetical protein SRL2020226_30920 [Mycobacterium kiyosense]
MEINFQVGGSAAQFRRSPITGSASVIVDSQKTSVSSPFNPATYFSMKTLKTWRVSHRGHTVEIEKVRPQMFGGLRPAHYVVRVDGAEVANTRGY